MDLAKIKNPKVVIYTNGNMTKKIIGPEEIIYTSGNIEETEDPLSKEDFINQIDQISYIQ